MRYATGAAFRRALEDRLNARARETGMSLTMLRRLVVFDRLLARLLIVGEGRWFLKGVLALQYRLGPRARTTKDMDLGRTDDEEAAAEDLATAGSITLDDYFSFDIRRIAALDVLIEGAAVRYQARAELADRLFETVIVDVGFRASHPEFETDTLQGTDLLAFADIPPLAVPVIGLERHVAEKVHAYTRQYGERPSTQVKDLVDIVLICSHNTFRAGSLRIEIQQAYAERGTHPVPTGLPGPPADWGVPYRRLAGEVGIEPDLAHGYNQAMAFLNPVLHGTVGQHASWDRARMEWLTVEGDQDADARVAATHCVGALPSAADVDSGGGG